MHKDQIQFKVQVTDAQYQKLQSALHAKGIYWDGESSGDVRFAPSGAFVLVAPFNGDDVCIRKLANNGLAAYEQFIDREVWPLLHYHEAMQLIATVEDPAVDLTVEQISHRLGFPVRVVRS